MPLRRKTKRSKKTAGPSGEDHLGALPDELLQRVLSFLPSDEAVQTCVLSRRWRRLWKSTPALRVTDTEDRWQNAEDMNEFVNHLLLLRDRAPLDVCEINSYPDYVGAASDKPFRYIELWIRYALTFQARVIRVFIYTEFDRLVLVDAPLVSLHLTVLELERVEWGKRTLNFSGCPALKALKMENCVIFAPKISSPSLRHLILTGNFFGWSSRTKIVVPSLVSLLMTDCKGRTPVLQKLPMLVTASVELDIGCEDYCRFCSSGNCSGDICEGCCDNSVGSDKCVLLSGLSDATTLELLAAPKVFIFRRDLALCPKFSKLKRLVLNEWSVDLRALVCLLQHSSVLEKLILQLYEVPIHLVEMEKHQRPIEQSCISKHLKIVEIKCRKVDERVHKFLKWLSFYGIPVDLIEIKGPRSSFYSSYFHSGDWYKRLSF